MFGMKKLIFTVLNLYRTLPALLILRTLNKNARGVIHREFDYWAGLTRMPGKGLASFSILLSQFKEYRNLLQCRIRTVGRGKVRSAIVKFLYPPVDTLFIITQNIGECLFIQHGYATTISADEIGDYCWINQQVTIGYDLDKPHRPRLGNGVRVCAGAKVIGDVALGDNAIVGANAVVVKDVPENAVVGGIPARVIGQNETHKLFPGNFRGL